MKTNTKCVLIAAGGTGGHIYPGLAVAAAIRQLDPAARIEFVGTRHGLENKIIPPKGYRVNHLSIGRLNANVPLAERLRTVLLLPLAFAQSWRLLRARRPDFVLGVGGHASGPLLLVASLLGYRTAIWEPNAMPGLANRILGRFVRDCWVVFDEARPYFKSGRCHASGMPVRDEIEKVAERAAHADAQFHILVFGGSQGARGVNTVVARMLREHGAALGATCVVHQTGSADHERVVGLYGDLIHHPSLEVREYLHDMDRQYARADLVVCRSGTGTLSELAAAGKPSILIPFPFASDDHQRKNAEGFVRRGAAVMINQRDLTAEGLWSMIQELKANPDRLAEMGRRAREFHRPAAARELAREFLRRMDAHAVG